MMKNNLNLYKRVQNIGISARLSEEMEFMGTYFETLPPVACATIE